MTNGVSATTNPNLMETNGRGIYWNSMDSDGIDRTSYFTQFVGQSVTITMSQTGSTAIYSGSTNAYKNWSSPGITGFVFGTGIPVVPSGTTGTTVLIQSAATNWTLGLPVYISAVINGAVTPTPTPTSTTTPTITPTVTPTNTVTPTPTLTPSVTPTNTQTPTPTNTPAPSNNLTYSSIPNDDLIYNIVWSGI
jgi:hypothetical protein